MAKVLTAAAAPAEVLKNSRRDGRGDLLLPVEPNMNVSPADKRPTLAVGSGQRPTPRILATCDASDKTTGPDTRYIISRWNYISLQRFQINRRFTQINADRNMGSCMIRVHLRLSAVPSSLVVGAAALGCSPACRLQRLCHGTDI
jgi:hypothetical protein